MDVEKITMSRLLMKTSFRELMYQYWNRMLAVPVERVIEDEIAKEMICAYKPIEYPVRSSSGRVFGENYTAQPDGSKSTDLDTGQCGTGGLRPVPGDRRFGGKTMHDR